MSKVTLLKYKNFVNQNYKSIYVSRMGKFEKLHEGAYPENGADYGKQGISCRWLVKGKNYFYTYKDSQFQGIEINNFMGKVILAIKNTEI